VGAHPWIPSGFGFCCSDVVTSSPAVWWLLESPSDTFVGAAEAAVDLPHAWSRLQHCQVRGATPRAALLAMEGAVGTRGDGCMPWKGRGGAGLNPVVRTQDRVALRQCPSEGRWDRTPPVPSDPSQRTRLDSSTSASPGHWVPEDLAQAQHLLIREHHPWFGSILLLLNQELKEHP